MAGIDTIKNQSLYFAATQEAARQKAREASKNSKTATAKKSVFANSLQKKQEEFNLASEGLPIELAGMEIEEAVVFLKDELDSAGDKLASDQSLEQIENYRKKLSNFMKYVTRNNYEVLIYKRKKRERTICLSRIRSSNRIRVYSSTITKNCPKSFQLKVLLLMQTVLTLQ